MQVPDPLADNLSWVDEVVQDVVMHSLQGQVIDCTYNNFMTSYKYVSKYTTIVKQFYNSSNLFNN